MITQYELERAIEAIEQHRAVLGAQVADTAVAALREKLASLLEPVDDAYKQITVLVADLSGFTVMSELLDAERVRDLMNAMWQHLDHVITMWGGAVDKHLGDGVIALFGLAEGEEDVAERAVQAALDMQLELSVLNERIQQLDYGQFGWRLRQYRLQMRIGVHAGPVYWGHVGSSDAYTAVGDTVTIAQQLESFAPLGGTLIGEAVYDQVTELFQVRPLPPVAVAAQPLPLPVYVVERERPVAFGQRTERREMQTHLIGRDLALMELQQLVQATLDGGFGQLITVIGNVGVGKSRLLRELLPLLQMGGDVAVWHGRVQPELTHLPYALLRDMLAQQFGIRRWQYGRVAHEKLLRGLATLFPPEEAERLARQLGPFLALTDAVAAVPQEVGFAAMATVLTAAARLRPTLLILDDVQDADADSLALVEYLAEVCEDIPLILIILARPRLALRQPAWPQLSWPVETVRLSPLTSIDARHLLHDLLQDIPVLPQVALDMVVAATQGNPLFTMELVTYLAAYDVIERSAEARRIHLGRLQTVAVPATLRGLFWAQFNQLEPEERQVLQLAAIIGPVFWDGALQACTTQNIAPFLYVLRQRGIVRLRYGSYIARWQEYEFQHDWWHTIAYESAPPSLRASVHRQAADWLLAQTDNLFPRLPLLIAWHQERGATHSAAHRER